MEREAARELLKEIYKKYKIKVEDPENCIYNFVGPELRFSPRKLGYLTLEVEDHFHFKFEDKDFLESKFYIVAIFTRMVLDKATRKNQR